MATFLRTATSRTSKLILSSNRVGKICQPACSIHTSKKKKDVLTPTIDPSLELGKESKAEELRRLKEHFGNADPNAVENYVSHGYSHSDYDFDTFAHRMSMFIGITTMISLGFVVAYFPDHRLKQWAFREAQLELERREQLGLPLISKDLIDPANIELPTEEEIQKEEIEIIV